MSGVVIKNCTYSSTIGRAPIYKRSFVIFIERQKKKMEKKKVKGKVLSISDDGETIKIEYANKERFRWDYKNKFHWIYDEGRVPDEVVFQVLSAFNPGNLHHPLVMGKIRIWQGIQDGQYPILSRSKLSFRKSNYKEKNEAEKNLKRLGDVLASKNKGKKSAIDLGAMALTRESVYQTLKARQRDFPRNKDLRKKLLNELFGVKIDDLPPTLSDLADKITAVKFGAEASTVKQYRKQTRQNLIRNAKGLAKYDALMERLAKNQDS